MTSAQAFTLFPDCGFNENTASSACCLDAPTIRALPRAGSKTNPLPIKLRSPGSFLTAVGEVTKTCQTLIIHMNIC